MESELNMTGEMTQRQADEDPQWEYHREIAKYLDGKVIAHDQYLGPKIMGTVEGEEKLFFVTDLWEGTVASDNGSVRLPWDYDVSIEICTIDDEKYHYHRRRDEIVFGKIQDEKED